MSKKILGMLQTSYSRLYMSYKMVLLFAAGSEVTVLILRALFEICSVVL